MNILAFGASTSSTSINQVFAEYTARQISSTYTSLKLKDYQMPIYCTDYEKENGIPQLAHQFVAQLRAADLIIISLAEHNGTFTAAFKNTFDWASRAMLKMFEGKKVILLATSPGPRGGLGVLEAALVRFPIHGAEVVGNFSLPKYNENFSLENGILNPDLANNFQQILEGIR